MDPRKQFCPNLACPARGKIGEKNIIIHSRKEARYQCKICDKTFAATTGTAFYRLHHPMEMMIMVATLIAHRCPLQAIVAAFPNIGVDLQRLKKYLLPGGVQDHVLLWSYRPFSDG